MVTGWLQGGYRVVTGWLQGGYRVVNRVVTGVTGGNSGNRVVTEW